MKKETMFETKCSTKSKSIRTLEAFRWKKFKNSCLNKMHLVVRAITMLSLESSSKAKNRSLNKKRKKTQTVRVTVRAAEMKTVKKARKKKDRKMVKTKGIKRVVSKSMKV